MGGCLIRLCKLTSYLPASSQTIFNTLPPPPGPLTKRSASVASLPTPPRSVTGLERSVGDPEDPLHLIANVTRQMVCRATAAGKNREESGQMRRNMLALPQSCRLRPRTGDDSS